jgi:hypothetical protein
MKVWILLRRVLTGAQNELPASIPALNFSSLMSSTSTTIQPAGTKPLNIDFLSRTSLLILRALLSVHSHASRRRGALSLRSGTSLEDGRALPHQFLLLNESSLTLMRANNSTMNLNINFGSCWVADASDPEVVTGYEEDFVRAVYDRYNFEIKEPIDYGAWCGREKFLSYQDLIFAFKSTREHQKSR